MTGLPEGRAAPEAVDVPEYTQTLTDIVGLLDQARAAAARSVNALMTATYWGIGRRIVVTEQQGQGRAEYGRTLIARLSVDLTSRFGRGFSETNLRQFRSFFLCWQTPEIWPTVSAKSELNDAARGNSQLTGCVDEERISNREIQQTVSAEFELSDITSRNGLPLGTARVREISDSEILPTLSSEFKLSDVIRGNVLQAGLSDISKDEMMPTVPAQPVIEVATSKNVPAVAPAATDMPDLATLASAFPLPWSAYVRLLSVKTDAARRFYETEALRNGWTVRQLDRQINSMLYERIAVSHNKEDMLLRAGEAKPSDRVTAREAIRDPYVLEFLDLKDEYSETDLEDALVAHLADFLLELGDDFAFIGRQRRMRIGDSWYRVDLVFWHRTLRCLMLVDLKIGTFSYADAGQMHMYLNYATRNWMKPGENPPAGLILCAGKDEDEAHYALDGLSNPILAAEYRLALPDEQALEAELARTRRALEERLRR